MCIRDRNNNGVLDYTYVRSAERHRHMSLWYRVVQPGTSGQIEPNWPKNVGQRVVDGSVIWEAAHDPFQALAIQATVRFLDPHSGHMRQATILHSLVN